MLVGTTPPQFDVDQLRRTARKLGVDVLIGVQGSRLVLVARARRPAGDRRRVPWSTCRSPRSRGGSNPVSAPATSCSVPRCPRSSTRARVPGRRWRASRSRGRGATPRARSRPMTCSPSEPSPAIPSRSRRSWSASTVRCRRTAPTWSRRCGAYLDNGRSLEATARELFVHPEHRPVPPQARVRGDRLGRYRTARGADPADRADPRLDRDGCCPPAPAGTPTRRRLTSPPAERVDLAQSVPVILVTVIARSHPADPWQDGKVSIAVFPGQGSQSPGFLTPWLDADGSADRLAAVLRVVGRRPRRRRHGVGCRPHPRHAGRAAAHRRREPAVMERAPRA